MVVVRCVSPYCCLSWRTYASGPLSGSVHYMQGVFQWREWLVGEAQQSRSIINPSHLHPTKHFPISATATINTINTAGQFTFSPGISAADRPS